MEKTMRFMGLALTLGLVAGCTTTAYQDESTDPLTRYRGECNGRLAVDYEYTVASNDKDREGARREVRCESDLNAPMPDTGPRVESPIERG